MSASLAFATIADIEARYPRELAVLAADETTGIRDDVRVQAALDDASTEIRSILVQRYRRDELARLDADSQALLRAYAIRMALYGVAVSFARSSERLQAGYDSAVRALQAIGAGKGALTFDPDPNATPPAAPGAAAAAPGGVTEISNTAVLLEADDRVFTRRRLREM